MKLALHTVVPRRPDVVIGGINHGDNSSIAVVSPAGVLLGSLEQLLGFGREGFGERRVAHLLHQKIAELRPVGQIR